MADLWRIRAWRYAFPASVVSRLGDVVFDITVVLWISTGLAHGASWAPAAVSGVMLAAALPVLLVGPLAGAFVDRHDAQRALVVSNLVQSAAIGSLLLLTTDHSLSVTAQLVWIYAAIVVTNAAGQFFVQARLLMIARTIPDQLRTTAFSVQGAVNNTVLIVAPPLAAPLLFTAGVDWALAINAASFLVSSILLGRVTWHSAPSSEATGQTFWASLVEGARVLLGNRLLVCLTAAISIVTLGTGAVNVLEVFFVTDVLHQPAALLGILNTAFAVGMIAGMAAAPWLERRLGAPRIFVTGLLLAGLVLTAYSRTTTLPLALALYIALAVPIAALNTTFVPLFMRTVPEHLCGRTSVALQVFPTIADLIAITAAGWLVSTALEGLDGHALGSTFGPVDTIFTCAGLLFIITALAVWRPISHTTQPTHESTALTVR
jgi:Na+/melibiose symporter-like transporter